MPPNSHIDYKLGTSNFSSNGRGVETPEGFTEGRGTTTYRDSLEGWAPGAIFKVTATAVAGSQTYVNQGSKTSATWVEVADAGVAGGFSLTGTQAVTGAGKIVLVDNNEITFGTGSDVKMEFDGTSFNIAPLTGMWADCPLIQYANGMAFAYEVYDDFMSAPDVTNLWTADNVGTGTTVYDPASLGGVLLMTCQATTDNACEQLTRKGAGFFLAAGKTIWYETRLKIVGDIQSEFACGLVADGEDLTAVADVLAADGVGFSSQDASLALALTASKGGTDTGASAGIHTMVSGTYVTMGFKIDGVTSITPYINGAAGTPITATIPDDEHLAPYFLVRNGDGTTQQVLHVDYVKVVQLR